MYKDIKHEFTLLLANTTFMLFRACRPYASTYSVGPRNVLINKYNQFYSLNFFFTEAIVNNNSCSVLRRDTRRVVLIN